VTQASTTTTPSLGPLFDWTPPVPEPVSETSAENLNNDTGSHGSRRFREPGTSGSGNQSKTTSENLNDLRSVPGSQSSPLTEGEKAGNHHRPHLLALAAGNGGPLWVPVPSSAPEADQERRRPTLRPYQLEAISRVEAEWRHGTRRTLLVLPTGCGKTVVFAELARKAVSLGRRGLVLAHRTELLEQAQRKLTDVGVLAGIEKAEKRAGHAPVVVASVQTLQGKRLRKYRRDEFGLVVVDEAHHAAAASYRAILEYFTDADVLGVTATPDRADGKALGELFESCAYQYELRDAIRDQWLVPIRARRIVVESVDFSKVHKRAGDFANDELAEIFAAEEAVVGVVAPLLEQTGALRTIVFAVNVAHATALAQAICDRRPGAARVAHGELDSAARAEVLADFRAGRFQYLVNVQLYTEGFDEPSIQCVAVVRPTMSRALFVQMCGRGTRLLGQTLEDSIANGKPELLLLDFTGNAGKHRLVGPLDALAAGDGIDPEIYGEAQRLLTDDAQDLDGVLDEAARVLEERRAEARRSGRAQYFAEEIDPFFGDLGPMFNEPWALEPATPELRRQVLDLGLNAKRLPAALTRGEAMRILNAAEKRRRQGLPSYKQTRILHRYGIDARTLTRGSANARISVLAEHGWNLEASAPILRAIEQRERGGKA
jgi:superfamily II DNA or RNA helicase